jgi:glycosidase
MSKIEKFVSFAWTAAMLGLTGIVATGIPPYPAFAGTTDSSESSKARELVPYPHDDIENQIFYFVMPDRFADGNPCNNQGDPEDPISSGGFDPTDKGMYHGGDIKGLTDKLDYIEGLGVTAIWLTPILKNKAVLGDSAGYHGYWTLDFTQLDPHLGSNEEMKTFIEAAHARGIKVFFDIIANHTADVIKYKECHQPDGSHQEGLDSCEYKSLSQLAAGDRYTPFIPEGEEYAKVPAWLNDPKYYHNQGDSTFSGENSLNGDFFGLDDLYTEKPEVVAGMIDIYKNLISDWKPDGFRMDTVKHVNPEFWQAFAPAVIKHAREEAGIKDFTLFGEVYSAAPAELSFYTTTGKIPSVLDFGFQAAAAGVVSSNADVSVLEELFASDDRYNDADSSANQLLTFLGNHDMGRLGHILKEGEAGSDAELSARCRLANALMFFSRGVPVIYYGDEQGFTGDGGDKDAREDMFASRVDSYNDNDLIGTEASTADDNFDSSHPLYQSIAWLSAVYKAHPVLRHGIQMARPNSDESGKVLTFSRVDLETGTEYLLAFNFSSIEKKVTLPAAASSYESVRGGEPEVSANNLDLTIPAMDFVIVKATGIAPSPAATPTLSGIEDGATVTGMLEVTVNAPELDGLALPQYQVRFEASRNGGDYETLAVDNNAPYRLFWDTTALKDGTEVTLRAAMSNLVEAKSTEVKFTVDSRSPEVNLVYENASALPAALIYNNEGGVMLVTDSDPANKEFTTRLDWGMTPSRLLVFADLGDKHKNARVEKPIVLDRNKVMQMTREDNDGNLVATLYLNSDGQLSTSDNHSGTSRELLSLKDGGNAPLPADVNVRGGFNGWGTSPLEYAGQGTYRGSVSARQGLTEYKFGDASWGKINLGAPMTGQGLTSGTNPGNLMQVFDNDGNYNFTLLVASDSDARRYLLHAVALNFGPFGESLFLQGNFSEGQSGRPFTFDGKSYRLEVPLTPGTYKLKPANGTGTRTLPASELKLEKGGEGLSLEWDGKHIALTVETEANYVFELNHDGQVFHLQVTRASLPGEDLPPFGDTPIYVKGEIAGDTLMSYQGNGIYEALVVLDPKNTAWGDDGVSAFKVGDANWSNVNLGATDDGAIKAGVAAPLKQGSNTNLTYAAPEGVYKVSVDASDSEAPALTLISVGKNYAVVHYSRKGGDYSGWGLHAWGDIVQGFAPEWKAPIALSGKDDFGRFAAVPMTASTKLGFILHKGDDKNTPADLFFTPSPEQREIWILQGDATIYDSEAAAMAAASE